MANQALFSTREPMMPNSTGAPAYRLEEGHALAQYAATGCLNDTYYSSAETQLDTVIRLCDRVSTRFVAQTALYARERGCMKDMPALLCAYLSVMDPVLCERIFDRLINDGRMLRTFVQIVRSGVVARRSLGSFAKRLVQRWFATRTDAQLLAASIGDKPSLADVIRLAHPRPASQSQAALFGWLLGQRHDSLALPQAVQSLLLFRLQGGAPPDVPFQLLTASELSRANWVDIARRATWQQTRMNLNTFARHGVFDVKGMDRLIAQRLSSREEVKAARVLPYQLLVAHQKVNQDVPREVRSALEKAMEIALENVPKIDGKVYVCPDVSGSMQTAITGRREGATSVVRCIDVAALVAAALMAKCDAEALPFEHEVVDVSLSRKGGVFRNAEKLAAIGGGGTSCSAPLARLNREHAYGRLVVLVSDNESWVDQMQHSTALLEEWRTFRMRNPSAQLVCIDIQPNRTSQVPDGRNILNVGGFSDAVFDVIAAFTRSADEPDHWVSQIERISL